MVETFQHFHKNARLSFGWIKKLFILILKYSNPFFVNYFRPISLLCNMSYKILVKFLANRIKHVLNWLISFKQSYFIKSRSLHDNIFWLLLQSQRIVGTKINQRKEMDNGKSSLDWYTINNDVINWKIGFFSFEANKCLTLCTRHYRI